MLGDLSKANFKIISTEAHVIMMRHTHEALPWVGVKVMYCTSVGVMDQREVGVKSGRDPVGVKSRVIFTKLRS